MAIYAFWNNKGGVGKSYLTFQVATEYARQHPEKRVLVIDLCPQANSSSMLLGGLVHGEAALDQLSLAAPPRTISGYIEDRVRSPYVSPRSGGHYVVQVSATNPEVPPNVHLVCGDEQLEIQSSRVLGATNPGPQDAWRIVHQWISDLISDITVGWDDYTVFIDCNPSFTIYTELAMAASDRLIVPFTADGSSKRAVRALLALIYGVQRNPGAQISQFYLNTQQFRLTTPRIYAYVGNRLTQNLGPASAFRAVVNEIGDEIFRVWLANPNQFEIHPNGALPPRTRTEFKRMFQYQINDANTSSVVSSTLGIPMHRLVAGIKNVMGRNVMVNQTQLNSLQPNIRDFVQEIE
ncbi:cellulose biosynthesis protein BcsQ [Caulobacter ginsengisoli]|uniref:Cellulose biosynthesis protein BcsQ n=1 Tax=Caulobacter ginsengisoli TaxID=400775 RepID=A0ABU0IQC3_9CAUL|nr:ParA family protein [Caulobacter ginsengisoli]MDQ0464210.1 cellulose biosynthesis protein BcsQ [Caulobacter ginsengisoli]